MARVAAVAAGTSAAAGFAGEHGANVDALDACRLNRVGEFLGDHLVDFDDHVAFVVFDLLERNAAHNAVAQRLDFHAGLHDRLDEDAVGRAAIEFADDHVLRHVHEAASEVAGIGGLERRIGQTLTRAVRGDEVVQHVEAFAEVGSDRRLDDFARRLGHQPAHSGKLADLLLGAAGSGVGHDENRIDDARLVLGLESLEHFVRDFFGDVRPDGDDFVVALAVGDRAVEILLLHLDDFPFGVIHELELVARDDHVRDADGNAGLGGVEETELLQMIEGDDGLLRAEAQIAILHQLLNSLLLQQSIDERHVRREVIVEDHAADGGVQELPVELDRLSVRHVLIVVGGGEVDYFAGVTQPNGREQFDVAGFERQDYFFAGTERAALALAAGLALGEVINAEHHILRGNGERHAVRGRKNIVRAEHEHGRFHLRLWRKGNVHGHLVAVEVSVEGRANERVNTDGLAFDQHRLESLNAKAVKKNANGSLFSSTAPVWVRISNL